MVCSLDVVAKGRVQLLDGFVNGLLHYTSPVPSWPSASRIHSSASGTDAWRFRSAHSSRRREHQPSGEHGHPPTRTVAAPTSGAEKRLRERLCGPRVGPESDSELRFPRPKRAAVSKLRRIPSTRLREREVDEAKRRAIGKFNVAPQVCTIRLRTPCNVLSRFRTRLHPPRRIAFCPTVQNAQLGNRASPRGCGQDGSNGLQMLLR